ncbi:MAG: amidoligase family protein [Prevotella sp.]|nr:amidoligase family protein [Prevotella sp.]
MSELAITKRTFGIEWELADVVRASVEMPDGFVWDKDEIVQNTDMSEGRKTVPIGGELNTDPMHLCHKDFARLKQFIDSARQNGAQAIRDLALQVHIYIGDLTVDEVKNIFYLSYYTSGLLKEICHTPEYSDLQIYRPSPTLEKYVGVKAATDFRGIERVFENNSCKGYDRCIVNIASYFKRKTVEFRCFNSTTSFEEMVNCVMFSYRFVQYAITHTEDDFKQITTINDFKSLIKAPLSLPICPPPLIYYADVESQNKDIYIHPHIDLNSSFFSVLVENTGDTLSCVNPKLYSTEMKLSKYKKITIYNNDEFNHAIYLVATGQLKVHYKEYAYFLEERNSDDVETQLALLLIFHSIKNNFRAQEYYQQQLDSIKDSFDETFKEAKNFAQQLAKFLTSCTYKLGTLNDALQDGGDVFFQFDSYKKNHSTITKLHKNSDYALTFEDLTTYYNHVEENLPSGTDLFMMSTNQYLRMNKLAKSGNKVLYTTKDVKKNRIEYHQDGADLISYTEPKDDVQITDPAKLKIVQVTPSQLRFFQQRYIKKVRKVSLCKFGFLVLYDNDVLGGFGFDYSKIVDFDLWLLSDFCTNNNVPRLSKLILMCIKSKQVQRTISRATGRYISYIYTKVYTHAPVSMKYRGQFTKFYKSKWKEKDIYEDYLMYVTNLGQIAGNEEIINQYQQSLKRSQKNG